MKTNCDNCGAILKSGTCDYCGTVYKRKGALFSLKHKPESRIVSRPSIYISEGAKADLFDIISKQFGESVILNKPIVVKDPRRNIIIAK